MGPTSARAAKLCTADTDVILAFHGYARAIHQLPHGRPDPGRFHVRGFSEQGTTTTPLDMVVPKRPLVVAFDELALAM